MSPELKMDVTSTPETPVPIHQIRKQPHGITFHKTIILTFMGT